MVDVPRVAAIPISTIVGFILPAILTSLPAPSVISYDQKQNFMAIWQIFPLTTVLLQELFGWALSISSPTLATDSEKQSHSLQGLRVAYIFAFVVAAITRITTITLLATSKMFPDLFAAEYRGVFNPAKVLQAASITPATKMADVGDGNFYCCSMMRWCLRWCFYCGRRRCIFVLLPRRGVGVAGLYWC